MTDNRGAAGPPCREIRQLLGVYVVGAIDPAERALVDEHLEWCHDCREELSSLAGLPALLGRVPLADAERLAEGDDGVPEESEPPAELLGSLLERVAARRRHRRWRGILALAAAVAIAAGGAAGVVSALQPSSPRPAAEAVQASNEGVTAQVSYSSTPWHGSAMRIGVMGIPSGTRCEFWVVGPGGRRWQAGAWTIGQGYQEHWFWVSSPVAASQVSGFQITAHGRTVISIPSS
jgi:anti-sigma-K factor RskA